MPDEDPEFEVEQVGTLPTGVAETRARTFVHGDDEEWIYLFGGMDGPRSSNTTDVIQRFNPRTYEVEVHMTFPEEVGYSVIGRVGDLFYSIAGRGVSSIYEIDVVAETVEEVGSVSSNYDHMGGALDGKVWWWGGDNGQSDVRSFDPSTGEVEVHGDMADGNNDDGGAVQLGDYLYDIGPTPSGQDGTDDVYRVDSSGTHIHAGNLVDEDGNSVYISKSRPTSVGGWIYTAGGEDENGNDMSEVYRMGTDWTVEKLGDLPVTVRDTQVGHSTRTDYAYLFGGRDGSSVRDDIYEIRYPFGEISDFVFEVGRNVNLGGAEQGYVYEGDKELPLTDGGNSDFVYIGGSPINSQDIN